MCLDDLKNKALTLPLSPGVYIMMDALGEVIYVGKAKKLKNRVTQYFQDAASHTPKTRIMVSKIHDFDVIVAESEFEALVLECSLIKQHQPKYNILLKDDKGYPFLRINFKEAYPVLTMVSRVAGDGASYFGPFGSRSITQELIKAIRLTMKLPDCGKKFPREVGKSRPCLNYHMNQCEGWCQTDKTAAEYQAIMQQVKQLLSGHYKKVTEQIRTQMQDAAEAMNFELAASYRDRLRAVEILGQKQLVTAATSADTDVIGYAQTDAKACFTVLHFGNGNLLDKKFSIISVPDDRQQAVSALLKQYYLSRGFSPKVILLPFEIEDSETFAQLLQQEYGKKVRIYKPLRGDNAKLIALAEKNATEEVERVTQQDVHVNAALEKLGEMLAIPTPGRIESFDISNISGTDIVAGMVVFVDGKPHSSEYKRFNLDTMDGQDDYAAMRMAVKRRFLRYLQHDKGFNLLPDLLLIDGGENHAAIACDVLDELNISVPVFGMVKDDKHRTRALVTPFGEQISIAVQQSVFSLIGKIQEETHRFAIGYHKKLRSKRLKYSELDKIEGIGPKRKQELLKVFKSISAIRGARLEELERILPKDAALAVYLHFQEEGKGSV